MPRAASAFLGLGLLATALGGCARPPPAQSPAPPPTLKSPFTGFASARYADPKAWLCLPGREDACAQDLDATELAADGARHVVRDAPTPPPDVDCFYVYPTVDMSPGPANHEDFADTEPMARATIAQAARFRSVCRLFVPLYRQVTIGVYFRKASAAEPYFAVAASDVVDAFLHYMGQHNGGRKVVLLGHSQGAQMIVRLMQRLFDDDATMRERLLLAMPIGWRLHVAKGQARGGTFRTIAACTRAGETGCVVAFRSYVDGSDPEPGRDAPPPGTESVCVDPAALAHGRHVFSRAFFPMSSRVSYLRGVDGVTTPFVMLRDFYAGRCVDGADGFRYLAVSAAPAPGDARTSPIDLSSGWMRTPLGLHLFDYSFAQGDLVDLVAERARGVPRATPRD